MITIEVNHLSELDNLADTILKFAANRRIFALYGPMGAGKTTLIKSICHRLGVTDEVNSPTFSIINEYMTLEQEPVYHFDFYRINKIEEAFDIGYENYFYSDSKCFIEWPEKIKQLLPPNTVQITIVADDENQKRMVSIELLE